MNRKRSPLVSWGATSDNYSCEEAPLHVPREDHTNREWSFKDTGYATRPLSRQVEIDSSGPRPRWPSPVMSEARGLFAAQAEDNCWRANFGLPAEEFGESHSRRSRSRQCQPIIVVSRPDNYSCEEAPLSPVKTTPIVSGASKTLATRLVAFPDR